MSKAVVYYSLSGNTKEAAVEIARKLGAKIFEIELLKPLPQNTVRQMIVGGMQSTFGRKPQIKGVPDNIDYYDEILSLIHISTIFIKYKCIIMTHIF